MKREPKKIHTTTNYERFVFPPDYPMPSDVRVKALIKQITRKDKCRPISCHRIAGGKLMINHDGGRRFLARKELGLPIDYILEPRQSFAQAAEEDNCRDRITLKRFLAHFVLRGHPQYLKLDKFIREFELQPEVSLQLFGSNRRLFKAGEFVAADEELAYGVGDILRCLYRDLGVSRRQALVDAIAGVVRWAPFDGARFLHKVEYQAHKFQKCYEIGDYLLAIDEIYNDRARPHDHHSLIAAVQYGEKFGRRKAA